MAHRIDHVTAAPNANGAGKPGFTEGQAIPTPIAETIVTADWLNDIQETIAQTIEGAGISLVKGNFTQLLNAVKEFARRSSIVMALSNWRYVSMTAAQSPTAVCGYDGGSADATHGARFVAVTTGGYILESTGPLDMIGGVGNVAWASEGNFSAQNLNAVAAYPVAGSGLPRLAVGNAGVIYSSTAVGAWTSRTSGTANNLYCVTWVGTKAIAGGAAGTLIGSIDGITWTSRTSGTANAIRALVHGPQIARAVAVGDGGTIITSDDSGATWTSRTSGTTSNLYGVTWTGTSFVAVGAAGKVLTSTDGITWTTVTSGVSVDILAVTSAYGVVVATCDPANNTDPAIIYSFDKGATWSASPVNVGAGALTGVAIHPRQREFCVVGPSGSFRSLRIPS